ncbi:MAG: PAS domain S-box protein, partial [Bryobacteraceae bacterium]
MEREPEVINPRTNPAWAGAYGIAICAVAVGVGLRFLLGRLLGDTVPYITFFPAVMFAAWYGGFGPGILASVLSLVAASYFVIPPIYDFALLTPADVAGAVVFAGVSLFVALLNESLRRSRTRAEVRISELQRETALRRQVEEDLLASQKNLRTILESVTDAFAALDGAWNFTYLNSEAERLLGRSKEELLGKNHWTEISVSVGSIVERQYRQAVAEQVAVEFEVYYPPLKVWLEINAYPTAGGGLSIYFRDVTSRKRAAEALAQSRREAERARDLLQTTLSSIGDAVIVTGADGKVTFLNAVAQDLTGWSEADAAGRPLPEVFVIRNERTGFPVESPVEKALREGIVVGLANHTVLVTKKGDCVPIEDSAAPIRDEQRNIVGVVLVFRDVTGRRMSDERLERSEERLRLALDAGQIGVWDWDITKNRIEWSERVYEIHGVERGTFPGGVDDFAMLIHVEDRDRVGGAIQASLESDVPYDIEFRVVHPSGEVHWVSTTARVFRDAEGKPVRMLGATTDVTSRRDAENQLRSSEARFRTVFADAPVGMVLVDQSGQFTQANAAYCAIVGFSQEDLKGVKFLSRTDADVVEENRRLFERLLAGEIQSYALEKRVAKKYGQVIWVRATATMLHNGKGQPA